MSEEQQQVVTTPDVTATPYTPLEALQEAMKLSLYNQGLARGLFEAVKALDRGLAQVCVLSKACNENAYTALITALCKQNNIPLIIVADGKVIGHAAGLSRTKADGTVVKYVGCTCAVIREWGVDSPAKQAVLKYVKEEASFQ